MARTFSAEVAYPVYVTITTDETDPDVIKDLIRKEADNSFETSTIEPVINSVMENGETVEELVD